MAEPLKALYDGLFIEQFAAKVKEAWSRFDEQAFAAAVRGGEWEQLELKARARAITLALGAALPGDYEAALDILMQIDEQCTGLPYIFFPDYVEVYGLGRPDWEPSFKALARFTQRSTAEFAIRAFLLADRERTMAQMLKWADDPNEHLRRLASEGTRPRLPWAQALPMFKRDPAPILLILEKLKKDPSLYVRKSVANNLNDIAKDHPDLVIALAREWHGKDELTDWIVRHGCRTLIKRAEPRVMSLFGYSSAAAGDGEEDGERLFTDAELRIEPSEVAIGGDAALSYEVKLRDSAKTKVRIEYGIDFVKSGGKTSHKRFLLSDREYAAGAAASGTRTHRFADLATRKHYEGLHRVTLWVNGVQAAGTELLLKGAGEP